MKLHAGVETKQNRHHPRRRVIQYRGDGALETRGRGVLGHPPSRVTTIERAFAFSRHESPEVCLKLPTLQKSEGTGNAGCRLAPAVSCARCTQECAHEHTGTAGASRHSLRNGFTAYAELSPETNSSCLRRRRIDGRSETRSGFVDLRRLDASHGRQDHTVLPYAASRLRN